MWNEFLSYTKAYIGTVDIGRMLGTLFCGAICFVVLLCLQILWAKKTVSVTLSWAAGNLLLALELGSIFALTLSGREPGKECGWMPEPFWSWIDVWQNGDVEILIQILANILLFIPLGFLLPCCFKRCRRYRYTILSSALLSLTIELIQGIAQIGLFETDDVIHNTLGACVGLGAYAVIRRSRK